jgi:hypothetical protein
MLLNHATTSRFRVGVSLFNCPDVCSSSYFFPPSSVHICPGERAYRILSNLPLARDVLTRQNLSFLCSCLVRVLAAQGVDRGAIRRGRRMPMCV